MAFGGAAAFLSQHLHYFLNYESLVGFIVSLQTGHAFRRELLAAFLGLVAVIPATLFVIFHLLYAAFFVTKALITKPRSSIGIAYTAVTNFANSFQANLFLATHDATERVMKAEEKEQRKLDAEVVDSVKEGNAHPEGNERQPGSGKAGGVSHNSSSMGKANGRKHNNRKNKK